MGEFKIALRILAVWGLVVMAAALTAVAVAEVFRG